MDADKKEIIIIGAGIIGLSCAYRLLQSGYSPILVDANAPGSGCSTGNAGHIATELVFPLASPETLLGAPGMLLSPYATLSVRVAYVWRIAPWLVRFAWASRPDAYRHGTAALRSLQSFAMDELVNLLGAAGARDQLYTNGSLLVAEHEGSARKLENLRLRLVKQDVPVNSLDMEQIVEVAPGLGRKLAGGLYFPKTGHVSDPRKICDRLVEAIAREGGKFIRACVNQLSPRASGGFDLKLHNNKSSSLTISADRIIVAAGIGSATLLKPIEGNIPLDTERGYALTFPGHKPKFQIPVASFERNIIMSPLDCGLRVTGGVEFGGVEAPPTKARIAALKYHTSQWVPALNVEPVEAWMGRRPSLPDYLPAIGESHRHRGLFYAFGHQHLGLTLSAVTATIMTALVKGMQPELDITPFRFSRFQ